jgi:hypothetical protein
MSLTLTDQQTIWDTFCRTLTNDPNPAVRAKTATAISKLNDPKFSPTLLTALFRQTIIQSLGRWRKSFGVYGVVVNSVEKL